MPANLEAVRRRQRTPHVADSQGRQRHVKSSSVYFERVLSWRTEAFFLGLTLLFLLLFAWRRMTGMLDAWGVVFLFAFAFFLFYSLNYRSMTIHLTAETLQLKFGLFRWTVPLDNIATCHPDTTSLWRIGGAGIHFSLFAGRYRAMLNFLEHPRLVISLVRKVGPVQDIAFSTCRPQELGRLVELGIRPDGAA